MQAVVFEKYGPPEVLQVKEVPNPAPKENEVLIKIHAASINYGDIIVHNLRHMPLKNFNMPLPFWLPTRLMFGYFKPKIKTPGSEFTGVVDSVGVNVKKFKIGDKVFGYRGPLMGSQAEYMCMPENKLVTHKPQNLGFDEACVLPYGALTALNLLRKVTISKGTKILINGASGSIGSAALQLAKHFGAHVTAVCGSNRVQFVKSLGADQVIDYTKEDFTQLGESYDIVFDILGKSSFSKVKRVLNNGGVYLRASFKMKQVLQMFWTKLFGNKRIICALSMENADDLELVKQLAEDGKLKAIIDKRFPLAEVVQAMRYIESGEKKGNIVIQVV